MSDGRRVKNTGQSACRLPGKTLVPRLRSAALPQLLHPRQFVIFVVPRVIPSPVQGQQQINIFPKALVPPALNALSHPKFQSLSYTVEKYATQGESAQLSLRP